LWGGQRKANRLRDPTFNLLRDEARMVMGDSLPTSYLVQQERNPVTASYLHDLGVQVIEVFSWNQLPRFFWALNPRSPRATPRVEGCQSWRDSTLSSASNAISATGGAPIARSACATPRL